MNAATPTLAELTCGVTYQPVYTFQEQVAAFADGFRAELLRAPSPAGWFARGFQVSVQTSTQVVVRHLEHPKWYGLVSGTGVYFQAGQPDTTAIEDLLQVHADLITKAIDRLGVDGLNSMGIKFVASAPRGDTSLVEQLRQLLGFDPSPTLLRASSTSPTDVSIRIGYRLQVGAASLELSANKGGDSYEVGLDCYSWDTLALDRQYLQFMLGAYRHFREDVEAYIAPLGTLDTRTVRPRP